MENAETVGLHILINSIIREWISPLSFVYKRGSGVRPEPAAEAAACPQRGAGGLPKAMLAFTKSLPREAPKRTAEKQHFSAVYL